MTAGRPDLELGVPARVQPQAQARVGVRRGDRRHHLRVTALEAFGQPDERAEHLDGVPAISRQVAIAVVRLLRRALPVIPRDERHHFDLFGVEPAKVAMFDHVVPVLVMVLIADVNADVMEERRVLQPLTLAAAQLVPFPRRVEEPEREPRHLLGVRRAVSASLGQLHHAAAAHVRIALGGADVRGVPADVIEDEPFPQRVVAQRDLRRPEVVEQGVEQHGADAGQIRAPRIEAGQAETLFDGHARQPLAHAPDGRRAHRQPAQLAGVALAPTASAPSA